MPKPDPGLVTQMLEAVSHGSKGAEDDLFSLARAMLTTKRFLFIQ